jgi:hypothetical protein
VLIPIKELDSREVPEAPKNAEHQLTSIIAGLIEEDPGRYGDAICRHPVVDFLRRCQMYRTLNQPGQLIIVDTGVEKRRLKA